MAPDWCPHRSPQRCVALGGRMKWCPEGFPKAWQLAEEHRVRGAIKDKGTKH